MPLDKRFYIHTSKDGILGDTSEDDVRALVANLKTSAKVVVHLHGGLVSKSDALEKAARLLPFYQAAGAHPVFVVWESGFLETIRNNLHEIDNEPIFGIIVKYVLKFAVGKLGSADTVRGAGQLALPTDIEVAIEFNKRRGADGDVPYGQFKPVQVGEITEDEQKRFETSLAGDTEFQEEVRAILNSITPAETQSTAKGATARVRRSSTTLLSPDIVDELVADVAAEGVKADVLATAAIVRRTGRILRRVVDRVRRKRDHGLYATVVEEVLRELYLANVGAIIWGAMKKDTADTFDNIDKQPARAGWFFVNELGRAIGSGQRPEVSLIAHSAGALYALNLLAHVAWARGNPQHPLPADFRFKHAIFLAPACGFATFYEVLAARGQAPLFDHLRLFSLGDLLESGYWEIPAVYPRSLLYFVSGVVERENGESAFDFPLVGMQRYFADTATYNQPEIARVRRWLSTSPRHSVWSEANDGDGLRSDTLRHGGFDSTDERRRTMESVQYILKSGW